MHVKHDGCSQRARAAHGGVEVVYFKPEQDAVADGDGGIAHGAVVVVDTPRVKLKDETVRTPPALVEPGIPESFVLAPAVASHASKKALIPAARSLNVAAID